MRKRIKWEPAAMDDPVEGDAPVPPPPAAPRRRPAGGVVDGLRVAVARLETYSRVVVGKPLRPYQLEPAGAVLRAIREETGGTFSVAMSRQAGKNELSAHLEGYAMTVLGKRRREASIVKAAPTFQPQAANSMRRLQAVLKNPLARVLEIDDEGGYIVTLGKASATFLSAAPTANVVGATASLLLEVDEAQDVGVEKFDNDFAPMAASTNAPRVFYGTAGTTDGLLERMKQHNLELAKRDGVKRHFEYPWWVIAERNPQYARFVEGEIARLGANHPTIKTQYELRSVAPEDALLDETQLRALEGDHPRLLAPEPGRLYVAGVDVAGPADSPLHKLDSTVVAIGEVELPDAWDGRLRLAHVRLVHLVCWTGRSHMGQHEALHQLLSEQWGVRGVAMDATGLGQMPCELLAARMGTRVTPVVFTEERKSELGFGLIAAANAGALKVHRPDEADREGPALWAQLRACRRVVKGERRMSWGVKNGHDDHAVALALLVEAAKHTTPEPAAVLIQRPLDFAGGRY